jgi:hypothetical protein
MCYVLGVSPTGAISHLPRLFYQNGYHCDNGMPGILKYFVSLQDRGYLYTWQPYGTKPIFVATEAGVKAFRKHYRDNRAHYVERRLQSFYTD